MGRPQTATDDEILAAAKQVFMRRGPDEFTVAKVASEVGLSRAAICLRFENSQALKRTLVTRMSDELIEQLLQIPRARGGNGLLEVAACIGAYSGDRQGAAAFFSSFSTSASDPELLALTHRRGDALRKVVSGVMPKLHISHAAAVRAFLMHLAGCMVSFVGLDEDDPRTYLVNRTKDWLCLAGIPFGKPADNESSPAVRRRSGAKGSRALRQPR